MVPGKSVEFGHDHLHGHFAGVYAPQVDPWVLCDNAGPIPLMLDWSEVPWTSDRSKAQWTRTCGCRKWHCAARHSARELAAPYGDKA